MEALFSVSEMIESSLFENQAHPFQILAIPYLSIPRSSSLHEHPFSPEDLLLLCLSVNASFDTILTRVELVMSLKSLCHFD